MKIFILRNNNSEGEMYVFSTEAKRTAFMRQIAETAEMSLTEAKEEWDHLEGELDNEQPIEVY